MCLRKIALTQMATLWSVSVKCDYALPLYRQERMMRDMGVPIRRNVMAGWFISAAELVHPLWEAMKDEEKKLGVIHADETFGQVLHNSTGNPCAQLDYWAYCTGKWEPLQIACFEYCPSREGKNARRFLDGYTGKVVTDGCSSYKAIEHLERGGCWSHTRRYWYKALPSELRSKKTKREKLAAENVTGNLHQAVVYSLNQREHLMKFMEHGDVDISNNAVERLIRNLVVGRKNWLFCDTEDGAQAVATLYSIIVTAHANGLDVRSYFEYVLTSMAEADHGKKPLFDEDLRAFVEKLLPWDPDIQARFLVDDPFEGNSYTADSKTVW